MRKTGKRPAALQTASSSQAFWMVHVTGGGGSTVRHPTKAQADAEAKRLLASNINYEVYVLKSQTRFTSTLTINQEAVK